MSDEFKLLEDDPELRQGDIFTWQDRNYGRPWKTFGIIITADCDLILRKTRGRLSYLPAMSMEDYLWTFWRPEKFEGLLKEFETKLVTRINKCLIRLRGGGSEISAEAALSWINRLGPSVVSELGLTDKGQIADIEKIISGYLSVRDLVVADKSDFDLLRSCFRLRSKSAPGTHPTEFARDVQNSVVNLPGDVFYLSGLGQLEKFGLFVMLRHISQCEIGDIAMSPHELRNGTAKAKRVARLNAPYVFSLAQNLVRVFSDIGLPKAYDDRKKQNPILFAQSIWDEEKT